MVKLTPKTLQKLTSLINEETSYRSGPKLVELFNEIGFRDVYGAGFPSRSTYTIEHLRQINGTPGIEKIIRLVFNPREFSDCPGRFAECVEALNTELQFDGWNIYWDDSLVDISFRRVTTKMFYQNVVHSQSSAQVSKEDFLRKQFADVNFDGLIAVPGVQQIVQNRLVELNKCLGANAPLSAIFLTGSILEAVLLSVATANASAFCASEVAPRSPDGKVLQITRWRLEALINVAKTLGYLNEDVHKFCHVVRDFRNYIHPFEQHTRGFTPDVETAKICLQVLKGAIAQIRAKVCA